MNNANIFQCINCNFKCCKKSGYDKHILTRKHEILTNTNNFIQPPLIFKCETCDIICSNKCNFKKHCLTRRHEMQLNTNKIVNQPIINNKIYKHKCNCGKQYKHLPSLYNHKKNCIVPEEKSLINLVYALIEENKELKNTILKNIIIIADLKNTLQIT